MESAGFGDYFLDLLISDIAPGNIPWAFRSKELGEIVASNFGVFEYLI